MFDYSINIIKINYFIILIKYLTDMISLKFNNYLNLMIIIIKLFQYFGLFLASYAFANPISVLTKYHFRINIDRSMNGSFAPTVEYPTCCDSRCRGK